MLKSFLKSIGKSIVATLLGVILVFMIIPEAYGASLGLFIFLGYGVLVLSLTTLSVILVDVLFVYIPGLRSLGWGWKFCILTLIAAAIFWGISWAVMLNAVSVANEIRNSK